MNDTPDLGKSFNADDLYRAQCDRLRDRMMNEQPDILAHGRGVLLAHLRSERDMAALKRSLFAHFGGEGVKDGVAMLTAEGSALLKAEEAQAALDNEKRAIEAAQAKRATQPQPAATVQAKAPQQQQARR